MVSWNNHISRPNSTDPADIAYGLEFLTFSLMIFLAKSSKARGLKVPTILGTIVQDATWYFLVMFTSHIALMVTLTLGRVSAAISLSGL